MWPTRAVSLFYCFALCHKSCHLWPCPAEIKRVLSRHFFIEKKKPKPLKSYSKVQLASPMRTEWGCHSEKWTSLSYRKAQSPHHSSTNSLLRTTVFQLYKKSEALVFHFRTVYCQSPQFLKEMTTSLRHTHYSAGSHTKPQLEGN